ncbi:MAG: glycosyltransferase family 4 protein [Bacteroidota bacterium]
MNSRKIGLLIINGPLPPPYGGIATYLAHALPYLAKHEFEVHTITDQKPKDLQDHAVYVKEGVHIHYSKFTRVTKVLKAFKHIPFWISVVRNSHLPVLYLLKTMASMIGWIEAGESVLRTQKIEIIHAYDYPWVQGYVALYLARKYGKKTVQSTFGEVVPHREELVQHDELGKDYRPFVRYVLGQCDLIVTLSQHCARELEYVGAPQGSVRVTRYGVDTKSYKLGLDREKVRETHGFGNRPLVLFLGQIRPRKGPHILVQAIPHVLRKVKDALVLFVGPDYQMVQSLKDLARSMNVDQNVQFLGPQPEELVPLFFSACDVFAFPSCTPIECLGLSMVQAMACGKPVVGSNIDGIPEVIVDGKTGFLVKPNDPIDLGEKTALLLKNRALGQRMGRAGNERVKKFFSREMLVRELEGLYGALAQKPRQRA